jgi:hypothetical protein
VLTTSYLGYGQTIISVDIHKLSHLDIEPQYDLLLINTFSWLSVTATVSSSGDDLISGLGTRAEINPGLKAISIR